MILTTKEDLKKSIQKINLLFNPKKTKMIKSVKLTGNERQILEDHLMNPQGLISSEKEFVLSNFVLDLFEQYSEFGSEFLTIENIIYCLEELLNEKERVFFQNIMNLLEEKNYFVEKSDFSMSLIKVLKFYDENKEIDNLENFFWKIAVYNPGEFIDFYFDKDSEKFLASLNKQNEKTAKKRTEDRIKIKKFNKLCKDENMQILRKIEQNKSNGALFFTKGQRKILLYHTKTEHGSLTEDICLSNNFDYLVYLLENGKEFIAFPSDFFRTDKFRNFFKTQKEIGKKEKLDFWIVDGQHINVNFNDLKEKIDVKDFINNFS